MGVLAVHFTSLVFYSVATILNIVLSSIMLLTHTVGSARARALLNRICGCCPCCRKPPEPAEAAAIVK